MDKAFRSSGKGKKLFGLYAQDSFSFSKIIGLVNCHLCKRKIGLEWKICFVSGIASLRLLCGMEAACIEKTEAEVRWIIAGVVLAENSKTVGYFDRKPRLQNQLIGKA